MMHGAGSLWDRFQRVAACQKQAPAFIADAGITRFAGLLDQATAWGAVCAAHGVGPGQRVVIWSGNSVAMAAAILGVWGNGAVPVLLGPQSPARHLAHAADLTDAALVLAEPALLSLARGATERATSELLARAPQPRTRWVPVPAAPEAPASILFTSGSSGMPKGVTQTHATLASGCDRVACVLGLTPQDLVLCGVPWAFDYGWGQLLSTFLRGVPQVMPNSATPFAVCDAITRHRPTVLAAVPPLVAGLTQGVSGIASADLRSVRLITNTGSRLGPPLLAALGRWFPAARVSLNYGLTETYRTASLDPARIGSHADTVGRAIPGVTLAIVDENGRPVAPGTVGEIVHRGAGVFAAYWNDPAATERARRPDPLAASAAAAACVYTGDLGWLDDEGYLRLVGRRDRQIKSMGVRVSPEEIEAILAASGLVDEVAVIALPHPVIGDMVVAVIGAAPERPDPIANLQDLARATMSPFMQPRRYEMLDRLPRTPNGKIDYPALLRRFTQAQQAA